MARSRYLYWPIAGASVWWREPKPSLKEAKIGVIGLRERGYPNAEVERVLITLSGQGRRYWRWRGGRWSLDRHYADPSPVDLAKWAADPPL